MAFIAKAGIDAGLTHLSPAVPCGGISHVNKAPDFARHGLRQSRSETSTTHGSTMDRSSPLNLKGPVRINKRKHPDLLPT